MSTTADYTRIAQRQILEGVRQSQTAFLNAVEAWTLLGQPTLAAQPSPTLPFPGTLPKPAEVVESSFAFAYKVLDAQRGLARSLVRTA